MDRILLAGIRCAMHVGVSSQERSTPQECLVDLEFDADLDRASRTDTLQDTLNYATVFQTVHEVAREQRYQLLEGFAGALFDRLCERHAFLSVRIRVKKPNPPLDGPLEYAGIELQRDHEDRTKGNR
jgi:dihydroneopterin aldolase